jgi:hemolysin activation/secretion protein
MRFRIRSFIFIVSLFLITEPSFAQVSIPSTVSSGQVERQLQSQPEVRSRTRQMNISILGQKAPEGADKIHFFLKDIQLLGVTAYSASDLKPYFEPLKNKKIFLTKLYSLVAELPQKYGSDGYVF